MARICRVCEGTARQMTGFYDLFDFDSSVTVPRYTPCKHCDATGLEPGFSVRDTVIWFPALFVAVFTLWVLGRVFL